MKCDYFYYFQQVLNSSFNRLEGSYEMVNALGTALSFGVDYVSVEQYIKEINFDNSTNFNRSSFNSNLKEIVRAVTEYGNSQTLQDSSLIPSQSSLDS